MSQLYSTTLAIQRHILMYIVYPMAADLTDWKGKLICSHVCSLWRAIAFPMVFNQVFVKAGQPRESTPERLSRTDTNASAASDASYQDRPYTLSTNAELFFDTYSLSRAQQMTIEICAPMGDVNYTRNVLHMLGLTFGMEWTGVRKLSISYDEAKHLPPCSNEIPFESDLQAKAIKESNQKVLKIYADLFASRVINPLNFKVRKNGEYIDDTTFINILAEEYCEKARTFDIDFGLQYKEGGIIERPENINLAMDDKEKHLAVLSTERLWNLSLSKLPFDFDWKGFILESYGNQFIFPELKTLELEFSDMPEDARLALPLNHALLSSQITERQVGAKQDPNYRHIEIQGKAGSSSGKGDRPPTMFELDRRYKVYGSEYRREHFRALVLPSLSRLVVKNCPELCLMMFPEMQFSSVEILEYSGAFSGLRLLSNFDASSVKEARYIISELDGNEEPEFYKLTNRLCSSKSPLSHTTLCLEKIGIRLDSELVQWANLRVLTIKDALELKELVNLLPRLPRINKLYAHRLCMSTSYDKRHMVENSHRYKQAQSCIKKLPLSSLCMYFNDENKGLCMGMLMFLLDSLPNLSDLAINKCFEDAVIKYVFAHPKYDSSRLKINGVSKERYLKPQGQ